MALYMAGKTEDVIRDAKEVIRDAKDEEEEEERPVRLPALDLTAQKATRRKILMEQLERVLPELSQLWSPTFRADLARKALRRAVAALNLTADNVVALIGELEWTSALCALLLLSAKANLLALPAAYKRVDLVLMACGAAEGLQQVERVLDEALSSL